MPDPLPFSQLPAAAPRALLRAMFDAAVASAQPERCVPPHLPDPAEVRGRLLVIGAGKASAAMARAVEQHWAGPISGLVVTRYGYAVPCERIEIVEAAHPVPDAAGLQAAQRILELTQGLTADDLALCLISGGGSALLTLPCEGLTLQDKQRINKELLASGANISEMNCVRKHLSQIKGGRLAQACHPAQVVTLTISDVPGDDPSIIASGPTVPDETTCAQALDILQRYAIDVPHAVRLRLQNGELETPKTLAAQAVHLIATPMQSLQAAADAARAAGINAYVLSDEMEGESNVVGKVHAALARGVALHGQPFTKPCVILSGGETTVTISKTSVTTEPTKKGRGGRAGEFCLGLAQALQGQAGVWALAADTDGIDGIEDNAGAMVTPDTLQRASAKGLAITDHLQRHDAYGYFEALGDLVVTGPTHTNVNDFRAILVL